METVENLEGRQSRTASGLKVLATQEATAKNSFSSVLVNGSEDQSEDDGLPEAQSSQFELDRNQRNGVDFVRKIISDTLEEAERKPVTPDEEHLKPVPQSSETDNASPSEQEAPHHLLPRIVKHKPGSITFWDCSVTPAASSGPCVNDSSDECSAGEEKQDDDPDCDDDDRGDVFEELPRGREPPVSQRGRERQRRRGNSSGSAGRSCGYEAEGESSSKEVMLPFGIHI